MPKARLIDPEGVARRETTALFTSNFSQVTIPAGPHPFPFRTRPLSLPGPMIVDKAKVGRCLGFFTNRPIRNWIGRSFLGSSLLRVGLLEVELSSQQVNHGDEISVGSVAARLGLGGLYEAVDAFEHRGGQAGAEISDHYRKKI